MNNQMNAAKFFKLVNKRKECEGIDEWISTRLVEVFKGYPRGTYKVVLPFIPTMWDFGDFQYAMEQRDFKVVEEWDDHPAACRRITVELIEPQR